MRAKVYNLEGTKEWVGSYSYQLTMFQFIRSFVAPKNNCETPMDRSIKIYLIMHILTAVMACGSQLLLDHIYCSLGWQYFFSTVQMDQSTSAFTKFLEDYLQTSSTKTHESQSSKSRLPILPPSIIRYTFSRLTISILINVLVYNGLLTF